MTTFAAIDVGSNAMRLAIGEVLDNGRVRVLETVRDPVRLGQDAFSQGRLSPPIIERAVEGFHTFHQLIRRHAAEHTAAIATSAMREAVNSEELLRRIHNDTGIHVEIIGGLEEARLMHLAISRKVDIEKGEAMLVDIGGGSVELVLTSEGCLIDSRSYKLGTVRMLQVLSDEALGPQHFELLISEVAREVREWVTDVLGHNLIGLFVGTGGNVETIGDLAGRSAGKKATSFAHAGDIERMRALLEGLDFEGRRYKLRLRNDRADVIYPATVVVQALMNVVWAPTLVVPRVGLREGLLADMAMRRAPVAAYA